MNTSSNMKKQPVRGMRDILPSSMAVREYVLGVIEQTATKAGFQKIETPAIEHIENLSSNNGGENESLIFKILKRGQALERAMEDGDVLVDSALRYDLTVPLARYIAANAGAIPMPFKALQMGPVWRADAPQKGRFRQFVQCDMDIIGVPTILAEMDIMRTSVEILTTICDAAGVSGLTVRMNDRRILSAAARYAGFAEEDLGSVLISLDKNDKIGFSGVKDELIQNGFDAAMVARFIELFEDDKSAASVEAFCARFAEGELDESVVEDLTLLLSLKKSFAGQDVHFIFDPTLVRGMGYYTGPIFECTVNRFGSSVAGGGRYDKMIGTLSGDGDIPACGFSIGFERIATVLEDAQFVPPHAGEKLAILVDRKIPATQYAAILEQADAKRAEGAHVSVLPMSRNTRHQIDLLEQSGYTAFEKIYND